MGNDTIQKSQSIQSQKLFLNKIRKVSSAYSQFYHSYNIYQLQQKPYDYYFQYVENSVPLNSTLQLKLKFYNGMPKHKNLVPVEFAEIVKTTQHCAEFDSLRVFSMYYNFTLEDAIKLKIKQKSTFSEGEIVYILKSLLSIGKFYQNQLKSMCYSGVYQTKKIFLSPEGHIKIYPFNENLFTAFYKDYIENDQENKITIKNKINNKKTYLEQNQTNNHWLKLTNNQEFNKTSNLFKSQIHISKLQGNSKSQIFSSNKSHIPIRPQLGIKKSKLITTLSKDYLNSVNLEQKFTEKNNQFVIQSSRFSKKILLHQESTQALNYKQTNKQDLFELGLIMMQLILLNQSHEYYIDKKQSVQIFGSMIAIHSKTLSKKSRFKSDLMVKQQDQERFDKYEIDNGKIPNIDLIRFSLTKLLPKKNICKSILDILQKMIFNQKITQLNIQDLHDSITRIQKSSNQSKYCIKFDQIEDNHQGNISEQQVSKILVKNQSTDPIIKTTDLSPLQSFQQSKVMNRQFLKQVMSKQSFFSTNRQQNLQNEGNLDHSVLIEQEILDASQILSNLKKSRKLVPSKLRSISTKIGQKQKIQTQQNIKNK